MEIRQPVSGASTPYRPQTSCIQAEEINSRNILAADVGPDIQFRKTVQPRNRRQPARADSAHTKGRNCYISLAFKQIQLKLTRYQTPDLLRRKRPVRKQ